MKNSSTQTYSLDSKHWTRYLLAASGTAALTATSASASIVYWNPADVVLPRSTTSVIGFDLTNGAIFTNESSSSYYSFRILNNIFGAPLDEVRVINSSSYNHHSVVGTGGYNIGKLGAGVSISSSSTFVTGNGYFDYHDYSNYEWEAGSGSKTGYIGLRFKTGPDVHYGWAQLPYDDGANTVTLHDFAYENVADTGILAGATTSAVPEPAAATLLLALAAGSVATYRRRRDTRAA